MSYDHDVREHVKTLGARVAIMDLTLTNLEDRIVTLEDYSPGSDRKPMDLRVMALSLAHQVSSLSGMGQSMVFSPEQVVARANAYLEFLNNKKVGV